MNIYYKGYDITKYILFLEECKHKIYKDDDVKHRHHIIPKFMSGTNKKDNLILLNKEDHIKSHIILSECFPEKSNYNKGNKYAYQLLLGWANTSTQLIGKTYKRTPETINKMLQTKIKNGTNKHSEETKMLISKIKKGTNKGINNPMFGKVVSPETRDKISKSISGTNNGMYGKNHSDISIQKMKEKLTGYRVGIKNNMYGKKHTEETKKKISNKKIGICGKKHTEETKLKIKNSNLGKIVSEETKQKMRNKIVSEETKQKISQIHKDAYKNGTRLPTMLGKQHTEISKIKMSKSKKKLYRSNNLNSKKILDNRTGIIYDCILDVVDNLNICRGTVRYWINNGKLSYYKNI